MIRVTLLCGGRGARSIILALKTKGFISPYAIVNAYDDGKSTGEIRHFFKMLGPSDIRKVQQAMLGSGSHSELLNQLYDFRFGSQSSREGILAEMAMFTQGRTSQLFGFPIESSKMRRQVQTYLTDFLRSLTVLEHYEGRPFNFVDCSLMNIIFAGAYITYGQNFERACEEIGKLFNIEGTVIPISSENRYLCGIRKNGDFLKDEASIVELRSSVRIKRIFLLDEQVDESKINGLMPDELEKLLEIRESIPNISNSARDAIEQADIIILCPGTQHSSLYPSYMAAGLTGALVNNRSAMKVLVTNIGADYETPDYKASDYISGALKYLTGDSSLPDDDARELIDYVLINKPPRESDRKYIEYDELECDEFPFTLIADDFEEERRSGLHSGEKIVARILDLYDSHG